MQACCAAGSALTTFNKGGCVLAPKVIAHRSSATRGDMLVNTRAYRQFCQKARLNDRVRLLAPALACPLLLRTSLTRTAGVPCMQSCAREGPLLHAVAAPAPRAACGMHESTASEVIVCLPHVPQASCRGELFADAAKQDAKVPVSHEEHMSTLRQVFRAADRRERQRRRRPPNQAHPHPHPPPLPKEPVQSPYAAAAQQQEAPQAAAPAADAAVAAAQCL
jgi:hypothetical protein